MTAMEPINLKVERQGRWYIAKTDGLRLRTKVLLSSPVPYDEDSDSHMRTIAIGKDSSYQIKPHIITEGPMKGYQTLVLVPTTSLRFLDLPIEVRDMIYEFILADETTKLKLSKPKHEASKVVGIEYAPRTNAWKESRKFNEKFKKYIDWYRRTPLSLILANKQVHNEAIKVLYRSRSFSFACEATLSRFFELNEGCAQHLTHIVLTESSTSAQSMDLIAKARPRSLQQLELTHTSSLFLRISDLSKNIPATLLRLSTPLLDAVYLARQRKGINVGIDQLLMIDHGECKGSGRRSTCRELEEQLTKLIKEEYPMI